MPPSAHPLDGASAKLRWAKVNLQSLQDEVAAFFGDESDPDSLRAHLESKSRGGLPDHTREPPWHWPLLVGDILHSFRSSLDYVAWELARLNLTRQGLTRRPTRQTLFPLLAHPAEWTHIAETRLMDIGEDEQAMIEGFQPYNAEDSDRPVLEWLRKLSNRDKHQALSLVLVQAGGLAESLEDSHTGWAMAASSYSDHMTIWSPEGEKKGEMNVKAMYQVQIEGAGRVDWVLDGIGPKVAEMVSAFEPVFEDA